MIDIVAKTDGGEEFSLLEVGHLRDHLMVEITIQNACRSGALRNMLLEEFNHGAKDKDDSICILVS